MKNKKLLYIIVLLLAVGVVAGGFFAAKIHTASENKKVVQPKKDTPPYDVRMTENSESKHVEEPFVTTYKGAAIPDDAALRGAILNQTMSYNGQGSASFSYKAPMDGKKEYVCFYIQNIGDKKLNVRLKSPLGNPWMKTSVEPGTFFAGEMQWGLAQEGQWICDFNNDDGSVISVRVIFTTISSQ